MAYPSFGRLHTLILTTPTSYSHFTFIVNIYEGDDHILVLERSHNTFITKGTESRFSFSKRRQKRVLEQVFQGFSPYFGHHAVRFFALLFLQDGVGVLGGLWLLPGGSVSKFLLSTDYGSLV